MKVFAFLFIATFFIVEITSSDSEKWKKEVDDWANACAKELNVSDDKLEEYKTMKDPPTEHSATCFAACILEKAGGMVKGKLDEKMMDIMIEEVKDKEGMKGIDEIAKKCHDEANTLTDKCDIAGALIKCMHTETEAMNGDEKP